MCCQPGLNGFHIIIRATHKLRVRVKVADVIILRRLEIDIVDLAAYRAIAPSGYALLEHVLWYIDEHSDDSFALLGRKFFQTRCLCRSTRETVENITVLAVVLRRPLLHQTDR